MEKIDTGSVLQCARFYETLKGTYEVTDVVSRYFRQTGLTPTNENVQAALDGLSYLKRTNPDVSITRTERGLVYSI